MKRALLLLMLLGACAPMGTTTSTAPAAKPTARESLIATGARDPRTFQLVNPAGGAQLASMVVRDRLVYNFFYAYNRVYMDIQNTNAGPVRILWDQSTFTDASGQTSGVYHDKVPLTKIKDPQAPTTIPSDQTHQDFVAPVGLVIVPANSTNLTPQPLLSGNKDFRTFTLNLAVEIDGQVRIHTFTFQKV